MSSENEIAAKAQADLAQQLGVSLDKIKLKSAEAVTWRDGSLGYGKPGMMSIMALQAGYRIKLEHEGKTHEYHTGRGGERLVYCKDKKYISEPLPKD